MSAQGTLYLVATPIGNPDDITLRALGALRSADLVVCEERKEGARLLHRLGIAREIETLNEHDGAERVEELLAALRNGKSVALVSDCGMPVIADPGGALVEAAVAEGMPVTALPGANAFVTALALSGFDARQFVFRGMLSPKTRQRAREIALLRKEKRTVILFDAPYRLERLLDELAGAFGGNRSAALAMDLTTPRETVLRGSLPQLYAAVRGKNWKREFVVVIGEER